MKNSLVSVVVPVYKVEQQLNRCVDSIVCQTHRNLEIILVDDGSPDNCPQLCEEWAGKDSRIKVIHKENAGLGMARNTGLDHATGDYVYFIDSDDYIIPELVEHALALALREQADVVVFGSYSVDVNGNVIRHFLPRTDRDTYSGAEVLEEFAPAVLGPDPGETNKELIFAKSAWSFFYSRELIERSGWRFVSEREIISEDAYSFLTLCKDIRKAAVLHEACYYYCTNPKSLSHMYREDRHEKIRHFYLECVALCRRLGYPEAVVQRCSEPYVSNLIAALKQAVANSSGLGQGLERVRVIGSDDVVQTVMRQKKNERNNKARALLFWSLRKKMYAVTYLFVRLQLARGK